MKTHGTATKTRGRPFFESGGLCVDDIEREAGADLVGEPEDWIDDVGYEAAYPA